MVPDSGSGEYEELAQDEETLNRQYAGRSNARVVEQMLKYLSIVAREKITHFFLRRSINSTLIAENSLEKYGSGKKGKV